MSKRLFSVATCRAWSLLLMCCLLSSPLFAWQEGVAGPAFAERLESVEQSVWFFSTFLVVMVIGAVFTTMRILTKARQYAEQEGERRMAKVMDEQGAKLEELMKAERQQLLALVTRHNEEERDKKKFRLLVIGASEAAASALQADLQRLGFAQVQAIGPAYDKAAARHADLLVFHDGEPEQELSPALMEDYLQDSQSLFLYYSERFFDKEQARRYRDRLSFANSAITLYPRIMELLRYEQARGQE